MSFQIPARGWLLVALIVILATSSTVRAADDVLVSLRPQHPRILVTDADVAAAKQAVATDRQAKIYYDQLMADANKLLHKSVSKRELVGPRLLGVSREVQKRITTLGAMYRMTGDRRFADRARDEMLAVAAFKDWNPSHFLDVAEMTAAMGIGYDWFFDTLKPDERAHIRTAIVELGLKPGVAAYDKGEWWTKVDHNWAAVCAGGLIVGALAVADEEPDLARRLLDATRVSMARPLETYAPDGGNPEGATYWNYETKYVVFYIAVCETALDTDFGMKATPGLAESGLFRIHTDGPTHRAFNYADAGEWAAPASEMFWMSRAFDRPTYAAHERDYAAKWGDAFHLLWFDGRGSALKESGLPTDAIFRRINIACFRSAWDDPNAIYLAFKGGDNKANHSHLDLGTFVLDAFGRRWAIDLGPDNYNLPGYFGKKRFTYYRLKTEGHNTLTIDGRNQPLDAKAPLIAFGSTPQRAAAVADLTEAYRDAGVTRARRCVALLSRNAVVVQDELEASQPVDVIWGMHTDAAVRIAPEGNAATLTQKGASFGVRIVSPTDARLEAVPADTNAKPTADRTVQKLVVRLPSKVTAVRIVVALAAPDIVQTVNAESVTPLDQWVAEFPIDRSAPAPTK